MFIKTKYLWNAVVGRWCYALRSRLWNKDEWGKYKIYELITEYNKLTPKAKTLELKLDSIKFEAFLIYKAWNKDIIPTANRRNSKAFENISSNEDSVLSSRRYQEFKNLYQKIGNLKQKVLI